MDDITVRNIEQIEPYAGPHAIPGLRFRPAREALGVSSWGMSVIEIDASCENYPAHRHASDGHEEVYFVLRGAVVLVAEGKEHALREGDFVHVPANVGRKFVTHDRDVVLLAVGGTPNQPYKPSMGEPL